mgnify:CR=1 FL=1
MQAAEELNIKTECIFSSEIEKNAITIYNKNFGEIPSGDITTVRTDDINTMDILCGGFPCQAFSIAGNRKGFDDTRGTLFFEIARIARDKRPKILFLENVKGLLNHDKGRTFAVILLTLDELGYDVEWQVLNSKDFGVPQNRERVFIIGHLRGAGTRQIFPVFGETSATSRENSSTCLDANYWKGIDNHGARTCILTLMNNNNFSALTERRTEKAKLIRSKAREQGIDWCPRREKELVYRTDNLSNCLTATPSYEHLSSNNFTIRKLTPVECERLQGYPDGWTEGIADTNRYKCLGNAVTVPVIKAIAKKILLTLHHP